VHVGIDEPGQQHLVRAQLDDLRRLETGLDGDDPAIPHADVARPFTGRRDRPRGAEHQVELHQILAVRPRRASSRYRAPASTTPTNQE
jgi:hypothetical protein